MDWSKNFILYCFFTITSFLVLFVFPNNVYSESVATSVTVGNSVPSFTVTPFETLASTTANPTNVGSTVAIQATAHDGNNDNYYLAICKSAAISANSNTAPTCTGGNWCISDSTTSDSPAVCSYTTLISDEESNDWYAYVCDHSSSSNCSDYSQGSGDSGSPFNVNHAPSFPTISNNSPLDPGSTLSWTTSVGVSDPDVSDTVELLICKTAGVANGACDGGGSDTWCTSSVVTNNPSCDIGISIPTADTSYNAYVYVFDNHNFGSTDGNQGVGSSYVVNNVAPVVSAVTLNAGSAINLGEGVTTPVVLGATITDNNGCTDLSTVVSNLYRSSITNTGCDAGGEADDNHCYPQLSCAVAGGNTCDGAADPSALYNCTAYLQYFADPTDVGTSYPSDTWKNTFTATDDDTLTHSLEVTSGVELSSLLAMDITSSIAYGNLSIGAKNDPLDKITTITATGNVGLDESLQGSDMNDGQGHTIAVGYQRYALAVSTAYAVGTTLTTSTTEAELNCKKTVAVGIGQTKDTWWGIEIPQGTVAGNYTGSNTIEAVKGEPGEWY